MAKSAKRRPPALGATRTAVAASNDEAPTRGAKPAQQTRAAPLLKHDGSPLSVSPRTVGTVLPVLRAHCLSTRVSLNEQKARPSGWRAYLQPAHVPKKAKLELLCLGYGRTGTYSLKHALDMLGWPCYHSFLMGDKVLGHEMDAKLWDDVGKGNPNWNMLFEDFRAAADWPFITYWEQYLVLYPDAKVLLTLRDPESWYTSLLNSIAARPRLPYWLSYFGIKTPSMLHDLFVADKGFAQRSMEEHYAAVRRAVPRDRLLEFHVKEGWAPLCAFLGEDVPDVPFPRLNDGASYRSRLGRFFTFNYSINLVALAFLVALVYDAPEYYALVKWVAAKAWEDRG